MLLAVRDYNLEGNLYENSTIPPRIQTGERDEEPNLEYLKFVQKNSSLAYSMLAPVSS